MAVGWKKRLLIYVFFLLLWYSWCVLKDNWFYYFVNPRVRAVIIMALPTMLGPRASWPT